MKNLILTISAVMFVSAMFLTSCKKESDGSRTSAGTSSGNISFTHNGKDYNFTVDRVIIESFIDSDNVEKCMIRAEGSSEPYGVAVYIKVLELRQALSALITNFFEV